MVPFQKPALFVTYLHKFSDTPTHPQMKPFHQCPTPSSVPTSCHDSSFSDQTHALNITQVDRFATWLSFSFPSSPPGPGPTQEELRRRVENGVKEFWYFVRSEVKKLASVEPGERQKYADTLLQDLGHQERCALEPSLQHAWWETESLTQAVQGFDIPACALLIFHLYYFLHCGCILKTYKKNTKNNFFYIRRDY